MKIETISGRFVDVSNPKPEDITINDIAHALSLQTRFNGHCRRFYSVAEHSWHVSRILGDFDRDIQLAGLLHDAAEAYLSDIPSPVKAGLPDYRSLENNFLEVIFNKFGLEYPLHPAIHHADRVMLSTEAHYLMPSQGRGGDWGVLPRVDHTYRPIGMEPRVAKGNFIEKFLELKNKEVVYGGDGAN